MADVYKIIDTLLKERGISGAKMSSDLGMSRSFMTELRKGRAKSIKAETAQKIADYFGVSVGYLLGDETEKAPTSNGERQPDILDEIDIAFYGDYRELSEDDKETLRAMARVMKERMAKRKQEK